MNDKSRLIRVLGVLALVGGITAVFLIIAFEKTGWVIFLLLGLLILVFAWYNAFFIPALDPADPDMGWAWLTTDPEIIEYIKFNFRAQGMWIFAYGLLVIAAAVGGFRQGERWAWLGLCSVPLVLCLMLLMMPWTLPVLFLPLMLSIVALALSRNHLFMAT